MINTYDYIRGKNLSFACLYPPEGIDTEFFYQNEAKVNWGDKRQTGEDFSLIRTKQLSAQDNSFAVYSQNSNLTYFSRCEYTPYQAEVSCLDNTEVPLVNSRVLRFAATRFNYRGSWLHLTAYTLEQAPSNYVYLLDADSPASYPFPPLKVGAKEAEKVESLEFLGQYLFVVLRQSKKVVIFDVAACNKSLTEECKPWSTVDEPAMAEEGFRRFDPLEVVVNARDQPTLIFVRCLDRVAIFEVTQKRAVYLASVVSKATSLSSELWKVAVEGQSLIVAALPQSIEEYSLEFLHLSSKAQFMKAYPLFRYELEEDFQVAVSTSGSLLYLTAIDTVLNKDVILMYKVGIAGAVSLYHVYPLESDVSGLTLNSAGVVGDYVTLTYGSKLEMFRSYPEPLLNISNVK